MFIGHLNSLFHACLLLIFLLGELFVFLLIYKGSLSIVDINSLLIYEYFPSTQWVAFLLFNGAF